MPYRLQSGEAIGAGLRRVAREELLAASSALVQAKASTRDRAVHDARRSLKRVRSLLALAGDALDAERIRLRNAGRRLSKLRDAAVMSETLDSLIEHHGETLAPRDKQAVRRALSAASRPMLRWTAVRPAFVSVAAVLEKAAARSVGWPVDLDDGALQLAIDHGLSRVRKAMRRTRRSRDAEDFHEWRKRAKQAWHHAQLTGADVKALGELQTALGDLHNVDVLIAWLRKRGFGDAARLAKHRRRHLREQVFEIAGQPL